MMVIEAKGLMKHFLQKDGETVEALRGVDLTVPEGRLTALVGPDGAGKTTLMRLICGLMTKTAGELSVVGLDVTEHPQAVQDLLSYMPQKFGLYEDLTVQENLDLYADLHGVPQELRAKRFAHLLAMTELAPFTGRLAGKLSGGMKQKLGLACTLVRSPKLLLLDEPTVGVDPLSRRELWQILQQLVREEHLSVFVSTAYMEEAALCETVYVLNRGRFLKAGTPEELRSVAKGDMLCGPPARGHATALLAEPSARRAWHPRCRAVWRCRALHPARQSAGAFDARNAESSGKTDCAAARGRLHDVAQRGCREGKHPPGTGEIRRICGRFA